MNQIIDFKAKTQALDALRFERIYLDMSKFAHIYSDSILNPMGVCPKLDTPLQYFEAYNMLFSKINPKLDLGLNLLKLALVWVIAVFFVALRNFRSYSSLALSKISKLALVGYYQLAHTVRLMGFFCMCNISMRSHFMVKLEGDTFECASLLIDWSTNPFQLCHPHLVVNGKASKTQLGAH